MIENLEEFKIAVVGGGRRCKLLLQAIDSETAGKRPKILGVAVKNPEAIGLQHAREKGIFTTTDYRELFAIEDLELILELTLDDSLKAVIKDSKPPGVLFVDHYEARAILDLLQIKAKKSETLHQLRTAPDYPRHIENFFEEFYGFVAEINRAANAFARETRESLVASELLMSQIINASTIPTFVIDKNHRVTHWNRACGKLTGYAAGDIVRTDHQWKAFRSQKRPTLADLILDEVAEEELWRLYGRKPLGSMRRELAGYVK